MKSNPTVKNIRAIITTLWTPKGYRPITVESVQGFYADTALDNDADGWQLEIGDPDGDLMPMLQRDNEVRVQIFGFRPKRAEYIVSGIADNIGFDEDGTWTITGRDLSSLAVDSTVPPRYYKHVRADRLVGSQATELGFNRQSLRHIGFVKKTQYPDGSESYWQFWYRLYRKEKMWLWTDPDGTLVSGFLNYGLTPTYHFGIPPKSASSRIRSEYLPIEHAEWSKNTQARLGSVWVYGHRGDNGFRTIAVDPAISDWKKRPRKIMLDQDARTKTSAKKMAFEELFEGKVGENELKITIADPGFEIRQNRVANVRIPSKGYENTMFVVGTRQQAVEDGIVVEVRLRELHYAITRRVPVDPKIQTNAPTKKGATTLSGLLSGSWPGEWTNYFVNAANKWHGPWNFNLFLATLLGMCQKETNFQNERELGGPGGDGVIWYPWQGSVDDKNYSPNRPAGSRDQHGRSLQEWQQVFANEPGSYVSRKFGVGPMQLTDTGLKHDADDLMKVGYHDQYNGGRWHPEFNIMRAAQYLRECLQAVVSDSGRDIDMWQGVAAYNAGANNVSAGAGYAQKVKSYVYTTPGYLGIVKNARDQVKTAGAGSEPPAPIDRADKGTYRALVSDSLNFAGPDQGIDFTGEGNIYALGDGVVTRSEARGTGWPGQGAMVVYKLDLGVPRGLGIDGRFIYHAEDLNPLVKIGDRIQRGSRIARATGSGLAPGIEIGWAKNERGSAYGTIHDGKPGGPSPVYGQNFEDFVKSQG